MPKTGSLRRDRASASEARDARDNGRDSQQAYAQNVLKSFFQGVAVVVLAAISSHVSQLTLSPVYGSVPAASFHRQGVMIAGLIGWFGIGRVKVVCFKIPLKLLPVLAWSIPTIQYFMFQLSSRLGPIFGPFVTELCTLYPLVVLSVASAAILLGNSSPNTGYSLMAGQGKFLGLYVLFTTMLKVTRGVMSNRIGSSSLMTRAGLQFMVASLYSICLPSKWGLFAIPSLIFSVAFNVHVPSDITTARLNSRLQANNYTLLHRQESLTGYLSVLENNQLNFRVMRCDHSLLGGEWIPPADVSKQVVRDPIYAVFTMLEAVRLINLDNGDRRQAGPGTNALVIGLGIGTMPAALVAHGINTTVVEIDPVVYRLATEYFKFPSEAVSVIEDANTFIQRERKSHSPSRYNFIVHDVFTGGVEPADLFTLDFMHGLRDLLQDDGVIAINYAGDLALPSAGLIVRTILAAFSSCRIFREGEPTAGPAGDFTNMVIFCKKTKHLPEFRKPTNADYLGSLSRESYMFPKFEIPQETFRNTNSKDPEILTKNQVSQLENWHSQSAIGHWRIMRTVLPAAVWENW
ncbi:predicted protein [Uncinocarpus reesii 1704]|uniref:PABS domain-containing protein n=1 Tax=Uncinocarpus reesii (strain UAMH 1704) TaxID=336963 RepID=C4JLH1_UNCRE|nr:uncharacterized protein UREG_03679 [Uncinocarpus reesii 1704]EEP78833.1 predicted protein [Uncinocarpus reesii 1704]